MSVNGVLLALQSGMDNRQSLVAREGLPFPLRVEFGQAPQRLCPSTEKNELSF